MIPHSLDQLLPSLQSMGIWTYWILALFAMLEAIVFTGVLVPGAFAVIAGGILVQRGMIDFFDLAWFVAIGTILGSEISFRLGRLAAHGLSSRGNFASSKYTRRAGEMLTRYGGFAMVVGRFFGPLSAFVPFSAAMAGMSQRRFTAWNLASALPYALGLPALGYFFGRAIGTMGAAAPRILAFSLGALIVLALLWYVFTRLMRALPMLREILNYVVTGFTGTAFVMRQRRKYPRLSAFAAARFETARFLGLTATILGLLFIYLFTVYLDSVYEFIGAAGVVPTDTRLANLLYAARDSRLIAVFGWITAMGGWKVVVTMLAGASAALLILRRRDLLAGLWLVVIGNQLTVTLLKSFFGRPRSALGYFTETSGSFPSGHAASSVAIWGMLFYLAWRTRMLPAVAAGLAAITLAFLIGLSRIYLIEHYLSDVLNGYLVGGLWLVLGIAFCEWRRELAAPRLIPPGRNRGLAARGAVGVALLAGVVLASVLTSPLNTAKTGVDAVVTENFATVLQSGDLKVTTATLLGNPRQNLNIAVLAPDAATLRAAMQTAGWTDAPRPGLLTLLAAGWADWTGGTLPQPLVIPTFWNNRPNTLGFEKIGATPPDGPRLHARFWRSRYRLPDGRAVFVGTLNQEDPLAWSAEDGRLPPLSDGFRKQVASLSDALAATGLSATAIPGTASAAAPPRAAPAPVPTPGPAAAPASRATPPAAQ